MLNYTDENIIMDPLNKDLSVPSSWKSYLFDALKFLTIFYISTFCLAVFYIHRGQNWIVPGVFLGILYSFIIIVSVKQLIKKLPMAAIILAAPTIPLFMLITVITMIPVLKNLG